jgi:magnesium transporter
MHEVVSYDASAVEFTDIDTICQLRSNGQLDDCVVWTRIAGKQETDQLRMVASAFGFHELVIEDILSNRQRPKVEVYGEQLFVVLRVPDTSSGQFLTRQLAILLCHNVVLTFEDGDTSCADCLSSVRNRINDPNSGLRSRGPDYLVYTILDAVIDRYFPVVDKIAAQVAAFETSLISDTSVQAIPRLQTLRSTLFLIRETLEPHQEIVSQLRRSNHHIGEEAAIYFRDVSDHLSQVLHAVETNRELVADLRDYCFAELGFSQNETMKLLTIVASVFIPLSFVVGLYGMNFDPDASSWNMPELKWQYGYILALGVMFTIVVISLGSLWWFSTLQRRRRVERFKRARQVFED